VILAKLKGHGAITIQNSKSAFVIGHTKEGGQQGNTNKGVSIIAEYLESLGM
jgi:profilin